MLRRTRGFVEEGRVSRCVGGFVFFNLSNLARVGHYGRECCKLIILRVGRFLLLGRGLRHCDVGGVTVAMVVAIIFPLSVLLCVLGVIFSPLLRCRVCEEQQQ